MASFKTEEAKGADCDSWCAGNDAGMAHGALGCGYRPKAAPTE